MRNSLIALIALIGLSVFVFAPSVFSVEAPLSSADKAKLEKATLAAGWFWNVEAALQRIKGVKDTTVGYTGGEAKEPNYVMVCTGKTGHAEAVEVLFDPKVVSYEQLLTEFFKAHDAAAVSADKKFHGGQYRSSIFFHSKEQERIAKEVKAKREKELGKAFFTEIVPATTFNVAEDYHQNYYKNRGL